MVFPKAGGIRRIFEICGFGVEKDVLYIEPKRYRAVTFN